VKDTQRLRVSKDVMSRVLAGDAVLLDLSSGTYFGLNRIGAEVWQLIDGSRTVAELRVHLAARFAVDDATLERDLSALLASLHSRGLVELID